MTTVLSLVPQVAGLTTMEAIFLPERLCAGPEDVSDGHPSTEDPAGRSHGALSSHPTVGTAAIQPILMAADRDWLTTPLGLEGGHGRDE